MSVRLCQHLQHKFFCKQPFRELHSTQVLRISPNQVTEVRIPVPWGHIAGKWWGDTGKQPVLALHGWQDNASTYDPLFELLPDNISILAFDSPGHGFSSHHPDAMFYHNSSYVMAIHRIRGYYKWDKKLTIIGHSEGGIIAFLYASIYPEFVNSLMTLDVVKPYAPRESHIKLLGERVDKVVKNSTRNSLNNPQLTLEEILNRWIKGVVTKGSLNLKAVENLSRRGVQLNSATNKYSLTRDPKVKLSSLQLFDENQSLEFARNLTCDFLAIKFSDSKSIDFALKNSPNFIETVKQAAKSFEIVEIKGKHHAHLTNPDRLVPTVSKFIQETWL